MFNYFNLGIFVAVFTVLGMIAAISAIWRARTPQGATAWALSLIVFPYVALPLYLIFGRPKFYGYREALREIKTTLPKELRQFFQNFRDRSLTFDGEYRELYRVLDRLSPLPFTGGNTVELLDNEDTFPAMLSAIEKAEELILLETYILRDDAIGRQFLDLLKKKSEQGVRVYVLYDELGSFWLPDKFISAYQSDRLRISGFRSTRGAENPLQINFRNHRRILAIDGKTGFTGGLNIGAEYRRRQNIRDTHFQVEGPAAKSLQAVFAGDWYWATRELIDIGESSERVPSIHGSRVLILPIGPADEEELCVLSMLHIVASAKRRLWLATPYYVPEPGLFSALKLAALRGVDVRVLLPEKADHRFMNLAANAFFENSLKAGIRILRYTPSFLHQKIILVDSEFSSVGSVNLDNRSMRLNFEISAIVAGNTFAGHVERMFEEDFRDSNELTADDLAKQSVFYRFASKVARLFEPIL